MWGRWLAHGRMHYHIGTCFTLSRILFQSLSSHLFFSILFLFLPLPFLLLLHSTHFMRISKVTVEVLRSGARHTLKVPTRELGSDETSRVLLWGGAVLQAPPPAVARQRGLDSKGVYVASHHRGSPANKVRWFFFRTIESEGSFFSPSPTTLLLSFKSR